MILLKKTNAYKKLNKILRVQEKSQMFFVFLFTLTWGPCLIAAPIMGPISKSMGGAGRAATEGAESLFLNPALQPLDHDYHLSGLMSTESSVASGDSKTVGVLVLDRNPQAFIPAGVAFASTTVTGENQEEVSQNLWMLGFGKFLTPNIALGASFLRWSEETKNIEKQVLYNTSLGGVYRFNQKWNVGLVLENILSNHSENLQPSVGLGTHYTMSEVIKARLDFRYLSEDLPQKGFESMLGFEAMMPYDVGLRLGMRFEDPTEKNFFTTGLGWNGPKIAINYAFEKEMVFEGLYTHSFEMSIFF